MNWGPIVGDQISRDHMDLGPNVSQYLSNIFWLKPKYLALLTFLSLETKMSKEGLDFVYTIYLQAFSTTTYTTWCPLTVTSRSVLLPLHYKFCMDCTRTACTRWIHVYVCYVLDYVVVALHVVCIQLMVAAIENFIRNFMSNSLKTKVGLSLFFLVLVGSRLTESFQYCN